jgi:hypothetical protein
MMSLKTIKALFLSAAIYDFVAGMVFCLFYKPLYERMGLILPEHPGYLQLAALYIAIFGIGFWLVYTDPIRNRAIVPLGILMKLTFVLIAFGYYITDIMPKVYLVFATIDTVFFILFVMAHLSLKRMTAQSEQVVA